MDFKTTVELPVSEWKLDYSDTMMMLGSCFAENIGNMLIAAKFRCNLNPFGILYNPLSIASALNDVLGHRLYQAGDRELFEYDGQWHSYMHHSDFSAPCCDDCLQRINTRLQEASDDISSLDALLLTFGTAWVYRLKSTGQVVGNCHKLPEHQFIRELLTVEQIVAAYSPLIDRLLALRPSLHIVCTVSPIRHVKDTMHGNQISKAVLLLAIDELCRRYPGSCAYFPSYEIQLDELRDYRFYADDMIHPSRLAVDYIWECFTACYLSEEALSIMQKCREIGRALAHRPFRPESLQYKNFLTQTVLRINRLIEKCPTLDFQNELDLCRTRLKQ